ncbi:MAG: hypothetical protein JXD21_03975 [Candidatus Omnitrophica bacterium]|nr:hypothetical protein [Candidatus Omnitrophota bacterium]
MLKNISKSIHIGMFFFVALLLLSAPVIAQETPLGAKGICEYALAQYERGVRQDAVHEFNKLLMLDPGNETALAFIQLPPIEDELVKLRERLARQMKKALDIEKQMADVCPYPPDRCDAYFGVRKGLCEYAVSLYKNDKKDDAMNEFKKLQIIDPENETALAYVAHNDGSCERLKEKLDTLRTEISGLRTAEEGLQAKVDATRLLKCE